jgi:hypothetical protein
MGAAKDWVERNFPGVSGSRKAELIIAYGAGLDAGLAEAQEMIRDAIEPGVEYTPLIRDLAAFDRKTADLRERGFVKEADSRDKFARGSRGGA